METVVRLTDHIARSRLLYRAPVAPMPMVLVIDIPMTARGDALLLNRYYPIVVESAAELRELNTFLAAPRAAPIAPDLLDRRPAALHLGEPVIARYDPASAGWPWLVLAGWPDDLTRMPDVAAVPLARGRYSTDAFLTEAEANDHCARLLHALGGNAGATVRMVSGQSVGPTGSA